MAAPHTQRDRVIRMVRDDDPGAHALALEIKDPWYRCQALAWIARFAADHTFIRLIDEAVAAAWECPDPYKIVASAAWPLRAMVERGKTDGLNPIVNRLLEKEAGIAHPVSRVAALFLVWQAVFPLGPAARRSLQDALVQACPNTEGWRARRTLRDMVLMVGADDAADAERIVEQMPDSEYRRQAVRGIAAGKWQQPRAFFWRE